MGETIYRIWKMLDEGKSGATHSISLCIAREITIVNSGCGGTRLGRGVGGAIPRERVLRLLALSFVRLYFNCGVLMIE